MAAHRVAYVIGELGKGGAEYQLHELLRLLDRARFTPRLFALASGGFWAEPIRRLGVEVEELPRGRSADPSRLLHLRRALGAFAPDVLHTIMWSGNVYGRIAALGLGIPVVLAAERNVIRRPRWQVAIERALDRMTDGYLVNSAAIAVELDERGGIPRRKIQVIPNGVDLTRFPAFTLDRRPARQAAGFDPERRLVAQVGRLTPQKDYPTFLRAAAEVAGRYPDVDFLVIGDGELRADLERLAAAVKLDGRVRFLGLRDDVPALLAGVDVLTLTSRYEGLPNVVLEAMATGAVAVATDVGGCREVIAAGETGMLVEPGRPDLVATALARLLDEPERARTMAASARRRVEAEFSVETMATRTAAAYLKLLGGRERTTP